MEQTIKQRQEIDARWQWATTDLFATDEAWEAAYAQCEAQLPALAAYAGKLGSAEGLYGYLTARDAAMDQLESRCLIQWITDYESPFSASFSLQDMPNSEAVAADNVFGISFQVTA